MKFLLKRFDEVCTRFVFVSGRSAQGLRVMRTRLLTRRGHGNPNFLFKSIGSKAWQAWPGNQTSSRCLVRSLVLLGGRAPHPDDPRRCPMESGGAPGRTRCRLRPPPAQGNIPRKIGEKSRPTFLCARTHCHYSPIWATTSVQRSVEPLARPAPRPTPSPTPPHTSFRILKSPNGVPCRR